MDPIIWFTVLYVWCFGMAQSSIEFIPTGGYTFADKLNFNNTFGRIDAGFNYGGSFQFNFNRHIGFEMMYNRMQVPAKLYNYGAIPGDEPTYQTSAGINYIMAGPVIQLSTSRISGFFVYGCRSGSCHFYSISQ